MAKKEFIPQFLSILSEVGNTAINIAESFRRESIHYKYLRLGGHDPRAMDIGLSNLKYRGILTEKNQGEYSFTSKGKAWYKGAVTRYNKIPKQRPWDKTWRLVIFDIPNEYSSARHSFRLRLRSLGFQMLQKSTFVIPYPCEKEMGELCSRLKISDYVCLITATHLGSFSGRMRKVFDL